MCALKSVIITLPKSLAKTPGGLETGDGLTSTPTIKFTTSLLAAQRINNMEDRKSMIKHQPEDNMSLDEEEIIKPELWLRGKKRRLDHLTWEEKLQRKKLKNRVAAQTSRDRKKAKLDELEDTVKALRESNERLTQECSLLRAQNESLRTESERLRCEKTANNIDRISSNEESFCSNCRIRVGCAAPTLGSAVSPFNPLPQGGATQPASSPTPLSKNASIILKIMTLYLLSRNCSANSKETSTSKNLKNSQRAFCEKLPQKWKQALVDQVNRSRSNKIPLKNLTIQKEWWGRHQKMWKPVEPSTA
ncbi:X-box-binding protein 1 [Venturia canescens]|uniref:X-box-binding protein 1 n=1 Tax=Venturia canescens TaxID=32260 RepID=UPI001C9CBCC1|nr:X-box-binding protein 1 [Venturia canescens]